jgi:uncharacterized protein YndB with AHSA1/START domain
MGDHFMRYQLDVAADLATVRRALTTTAGIEGWWTDAARVPEDVGGHLELDIPGVPQPFDLELAEATDQRVVWRAGSFPPFWEGTSVRWEIAPNPEGEGTRVVMSHAGWEPDHPIVGVVTLGWGEILPRLRRFAESGDPDPYFVN